VLAFPLASPRGPVAPATAISVLIYRMVCEKSLRLELKFYTAESKARYWCGNPSFGYLARSLIR
jgi:hypothetical protein